ncbi:thermonuclease family protein [Sagittula salina]|uniref:Thermonuclease family protein n=1 Tax=Sagittula salina TaxID=2820268 RepID=A0A940S4T0_9RHOB|nr:thermonuclease family protein [Sagittula salina]MBP0484205.1 thermonuclease family protein [Sagittula salina]
MFRYLAIVAVLLGGPVAASDLVGAVHVIDGDTIDVGDHRVRLHGIDTPEMKQRCGGEGRATWACGAWVARHVAQVYEGRMARCDVRDVDRYGRLVARCTVDGQDIGRGLVQQGLALAYTTYSNEYASDEARAKAAGLGLHAVEMDDPAQFRKRATTAQTEALHVSGNCQIKGNISGGGTRRIYHMPGQQHYRDTRISASKGERWFCSAAEAEAAGWRAAKR